MAAGIKNAAFVKTRISIACADTSWGGGSRSVIKWKMFLVFLPLLPFQLLLFE